VSARANNDVHSITLITRVGCHLCETAEQQLRALAGELRFTYREVDVDGSPELKRAYADKVPVIVLDGREFGHFRVDEPRLRKSLAR
jgi:glutaredoxin